MTENSVDDLHYGHYGEIIYDQQNHAWISKRALVKTNSKLRRVGVSVQYAAASYLESSISGNEKLEYHARQRNVRKFVIAHPEAALAYPLLLEFLPIREDTAGTFNDDIHSVGDLIAVGKARAVDVSNGGSRHVLHSLLAVAGNGENGQFVNMFEMRSARQGWEHDQSIWLNAFDIKETESARWESDGGHIRQICFAQGVEDDTTLLAVRTATSITIMRPLYQDNPIIRTRVAGHPSSRILPNPLITLRMPPLGNAECADVAFNPWYQRQLAAVNSAGCFVVWTFQGNQLVEAENLGGNMSEQFSVDDEDRDAFHHYDGWHKISWIGNANTIVVCNRTRLEAFELRGQTIVAESTDLLAAHSPVWVLDMRKSPFRDDDLFIITTTNILWLRFRRDHISGKNLSFRGLFETIFSWRHDRDIKDMTLQLSFRPMLHAFSIILSSRQNSLITEFQCTFPDFEAPMMISASTPTFVEPIMGDTETLDKNDDEQLLSGLVFLPLEYGERSFQSSQYAIGNQYKNKGCTFVQVIRLRRNSSLDGQMFYSFDRTLKSGQKKQALHVVGPKWKRVRKRYAPRKKEQVSDDFIMGDEEATQSGVDEPVTRLKVHTRGSTHSGANHTKAYDEEGIAWSVPNELAYEQIQEIVIAGNGNIEDPAPIIGETIRESVVAHPTLQPLQSALWEILSTFSDIENSSTATESSLIEYVGSLNLEARLKISRLTNLGCISLGGRAIDDMSVSSISGKLKEIYLNPIARTTPDDVRSRQKELILHTAQNLFFANIGLQTLSTEVPSQDHVSTLLADGINHPSSQGYSQSTSSQTRLLRNSQAFSSQPRSSQLYVPSTASSPHPTPSAISRLCAYTTISNPPSTPLKHLPDIVSHWTPATDPSTYDWEATRVRVSGATGGFIAGSAMTDADRERQLRKTERQVEREKKKEGRMAKRRRLGVDGGYGASQSQDVDLSQADTAGWMSSQTPQDPSQSDFETQPRSQPLRPLLSPSAFASRNSFHVPERLRSSPGFVGSESLPNQQQSQSYTQSQSRPLVTASQLEPGKFGGRPQRQMPVRDRRGGGVRKAGF